MQPARPQNQPFDAFADDDSSYDELDAFAGGLSGPARTPCGAAHHGDEFESLLDLAGELDGAELDALLPRLGRAAARRVVRAVMPSAARQARPPAARQMARAVTQATQRAGRAMGRRHGGAGVRSLGRVVEAVARRAAPHAVSPARMSQAILSTAARVNATPALVYRLARPVTGTCSCLHRDDYTSDGQSCLQLRTTGVCAGPYTGTRADTASCQCNARENAPSACRGCLGHCHYRRSR